MAGKVSSEDDPRARILAHSSFYLTSHGSVVKEMEPEFLIGIRRLRLDVSSGCFFDCETKEDAPSAPPSLSTHKPSLALRCFSDDDACRSLPTCRKEEHMSRALIKHNRCGLLMTSVALCLLAACGPTDEDNNGMSNNSTTAKWPDCAA